MIDSTLVARMPLLSKPVNTSGDAYIARALDNAHNPGIFKSFKVLACTPDSSALVVDMKGLFLEGSAFTKPFLRHRLTDTMDSCRAIILCNRINLLFWVYRLQKII